jgi:hypothetical protein
VLSHLTALSNGFIWLDHAHIEGGLALAQPGQVAALFGGGFAGTGFYRPLMSVSLSLDAALGGGPLVYHATTLAWHAAAATLTTIAGGALGLTRRAALVAGLLFGAHPATSLVADAIAFRSEAMIAVALLLAVTLHLGGRPRLAALGLLAGALTKETALVLGPLFMLALFAGERRRPAGNGDRPLARWGPMASALAVAMGLRMAFAPPWRSSFATLSASQSVGTRLASLAKSALRAVLPFDGSVCDAFPVASVGSARSLAGGLVALGVGWLAWRRRGPALLMALALLPSLDLVPISRWWSPHYLYLPLAFAAMVVAGLADRGPRALAGVLGMVAAFAVLSLAEGRRYRSDQSLWAAELAAHPECREAQFYQGEVHRERQNWEAAARHYGRALAATPGVLSYVDQPAAAQNLGVVRLEQGRLAEAQAAFQVARDLAADPSARRRLTHNIAVVALRAGRPDEAARLLEPETARPDALPESLLVEARALQRLGRQGEARALIRRLEGRR